MFDVGFWELSLIGVIALIVVGPDRLPGMARTVGFWIGRARRYVDQVRRDVEREIHAEELRDAMHGKGTGLDDLYEAVDETRGAVRELESDLAAAADDAGTRDAAKEPVTGDVDEAEPGDGAAERAALPAPEVASPTPGPEAAPGESARPWTAGIHGPVEEPPGAESAEPATSSAPEAEPEPSRDERRETHG